MADQYEIAEESACYTCMTRQQLSSAITYLLAQMAGLSVEQVVAGAACFTCMTPQQLAAGKTYLLTQL